MTTVSRLITHGGPFHADDTLSYAVLHALFPEAPLVRTRDESVISAAGADTLIFDIGGRHDAAQLRFDHHQKGNPLRPCGIPYSALGLLWKHFGRDYVALRSRAGAEDVDSIHAEIDRDFVRLVDAGDNGVAGFDALANPMSLSTLIEDMRPDFDTDPDRLAEATYLAFTAAARMAGAVLDTKIRNAAARRRARSIARAAIAGRTDPRWIELPVKAPFMAETLSLGEEDILYALLPGDDEWEIKAVNVTETSFELRKDLPANWAGLRGKDLAAATGVPDAVFCHKNLFIATARSRDGAIAMLEQALRN